MQAQNQTVKGRVTDVTGNPLPGASIAVQKGRTGAVTNAEGRFEINVAPGTKLTINFTGYKSATVIADPSAPLQVVLEDDIAKLDEVIVTGLATTVKRRNAANSVATISAKELAGAAPAQTFDAALSGKITGANITANSGAPGGGLSIKLRGVSSIYGTIQPLFVIDGVIVSNRATSTGINVVSQAGGPTNATSGQDNPASRIADLNPNDIENVEILKGASASAIYGSQASAGVVIITTKKGRSGKTSFAVNQDLGVATARKLLGMKKDLTDEDLEARDWDIPTVRAAQASGKFFDYEKEVFGGKGFLRNTTVSMNGGSEKTTFHLSAGLKDEEGIVRNTGYSNANVRLNLNHKVSDRVKFGFTSAYMNTNADRGLFGNENSGNTVGYGIIATSPWIDLHPDANGIYPNPRNGANILQTIAHSENSEKVNRVLTGGTAEFVLQQSPTSTTRLMGRAGLDFYHTKSLALFPAMLHFEAVTGGRNIRGNTYEMNTSWAGFLVNTFTPGQGNLTFTTTGGITHEAGDYDQLLNIASRLVGDETSQGQAAAIRVTQTRSSYRNDGLFFQEELAYKEFLNFTVGARFDRSTNNGDYKKFNIYPKANASWNITKMGQWDGALVNDLKFRIAYGESSGFPTFNSRFTNMAPSVIGGLPGSIVSLSLGDPNIKSERQTELEGGFDLSLFNGKLNFEATVYNKVIRDLLVAADWPGSTGFNSRWVNAGELRNRGVELSLRATPFNNRNVRWNTTVNYWLNRSKVLKLNVPAFDQGDSFGAGLGTIWIEEGKSATQLVIEEAAGLRVLGDIEPRFQLSWFNDVNFFKNWTFRAMLHYKKGGANVNLTRYLRDGSGLSSDFSDKNDKGEYLAEARGNDVSQYTEDATYLRLREVALFYQLPVRPRGISNIQIGVSANNYFTLAKYSGYDPEVSNFGSTFGTGIDVAPYAATKRLQFHLSVNF
ncbi:SusC/RagA family TonB-linked outer membrane protein [Chitinophaga pollutisoli]|uniref:SusC/RagA family TonB-linked outer membrane protein n=1 Tax=Chitinophaga pollutisoli TaxID=3133966 RepID=A0ABZ2YSX8_9BACT